MNGKYKPVRFPVQAFLFRFQKYEIRVIGQNELVFNPKDKLDMS